MVVHRKEAEMKVKLARGGGTFGLFQWSGVESAREA